MIELLLCESVVNLGKVGDRVKVSDGYGRNYLLPYNKAVVITDENLKIFEKKRKEYEKQEAEVLATAKQQSKPIEAFELKFTEKVLADNPEKLYGSIGVVDIVQKFLSNNIEVKKNQVSIGVGLIKTTGNFECAIALHPEVVVKKTITVEAMEEEH